MNKVILKGTLPQQPTAWLTGLDYTARLPRMHSFQCRSEPCQYVTGATHVDSAK